jgi:flagellar hook assembly protein FlgD
MLAGSHEVKWNGKDNAGATVTSGVYFVKLSSGTYVETKKMMFLK